MIAPPGDAERDRIEEILTRHVSLRWDVLPAWGVHDLDRWPDYPMVAEFLTLTAVQVLQRREMRHGASPTAGLRAACDELGLNSETVRSRLREHRKKYESAADPGQGGNPTQTAEIAV